jgi:hypothetical protein
MKTKIYMNLVIFTHFRSLTHFWRLQASIQNRFIFGKILSFKFGDIAIHPCCCCDYISSVQNPLIKSPAASIAIAAATAAPGNLCRQTTPSIPQSTEPASK